MWYKEILMTVEKTTCGMKIFLNQDLVGLMMVKEAVLFGSIIGSISKGLKYIFYQCTQSIVLWYRIKIIQNCYKTGDTPHKHDIYAHVFRRYHISY